MVTIDNLTKCYNDICVLNIPSLEIKHGETVGLIGNNGAGKTTLFRLILDLTEPNSGSVMVNNQIVKGHDEWKGGVGAFLDESFLIDFLSVKEYFAFLGGLHGLNTADINLFREQMEPLFAGEISDKKLIREYSSGNKKKIGIAATLIGRPQLLILDEPFTALDPTSQIRLKRLLNEMNQTYGITSFISSHDLNHIVDVSQRIILLNKGLIVKDLATNQQTLHELQQYFDTPINPAHID